MKKENQNMTKNIDRGYIFVGEKCGRDKNGVFRCVCGKCKSNTSKQ